MEFSGKMSEVSEAAEVKGGELEGFDPEALDKYDKILGDDKLEESDVSDISDEDVEKLEPEDLNDKFDKLFEGDDFFEKQETEHVDQNDLPELGDDADQREASDREKDVNNDLPENRKGLTNEEKAKIKDETGWSDEIIDAIGSMEEYEIYKEAGLVEAEINGKKCLVRNDIDWGQKDAMGRTNKERAEQGLSPINKDGKVIELHHIGQHSDSPLAELTSEEHRGKENDTTLHDKSKESEIDRQDFAKERNEHWKSRADEGGNS